MAAVKRARQRLKALHPRLASALQQRNLYKAKACYNAMAADFEKADPETGARVREAIRALELRDQGW